MGEPKTINSLGLEVTTGSIHPEEHATEALRNQLEGIGDPSDLPDIMHFRTMIGNLATAEPDLVINNTRGTSAGTSRFPSWYRLTLDHIKDLAGHAGNIVIHLSDADHAALQEHGKLADEEEGARSAEQRAITKEGYKAVNYLIYITLKMMVKDPWAQQTFFGANQPHYQDGRMVLTALRARVAPNSDEELAAIQDKITSAASDAPHDMPLTDFYLHLINLQDDLLLRWPHKKEVTDMMAITIRNQFLKWVNARDEIRTVGIIHAKANIHEIYRACDEHLQRSGIKELSARGTTPATFQAVAPPSADDHAATRRDSHYDAEPEFPRAGGGPPRSRRDRDQRQQHQRQGNRPQRPRVECGYCGKPGHRGNECRMRHSHEAQGRFQANCLQPPEQWYSTKEESERHRNPDRFLDSADTPTTRYATAHDSYKTFMATSSTEVNMDLSPQYAMPVATSDLSNDQLREAVRSVVHKHPDIGAEAVIEHIKATYPNLSEAVPPRRTETTVHTAVQQIPTETTPQATTATTGSTVPHNHLVCDSGSTHHLIALEEGSRMTNLTTISVQIKGVGGTTVNATAKGDLPIAVTTTGGDTRIILIKGALLVPEIHTSILSLKRMAIDNDITSRITSRGTVLRSNTTGAEVNTVAIGGLDYLVHETVTTNPESYLTEAQIEHEKYPLLDDYEMSDKTKFFHSAWALPGAQTLHRIAKDQELDLPRLDAKALDDCEASHLANQRKRRVTPGFEYPRSTTPGEYLHIDTFGTTKTKTADDVHYVLFVKDDATGLVTVYKLQSKANAHKALAAHLNRYPGCRRVRFDQAKEFTSTAMNALLHEHRVSATYRSTTAPHTHGFVEKAIGDVVRRTRAMLTDGGVPTAHWTLAILHAALLHNTTPRKDRASPYEEYHGVKPKMKNLIPFGRAVAAIIAKQGRTKLQPTAERLMVISHDAASDRPIVSDLNNPRAQQRVVGDYKLLPTKFFNEPASTTPTTTLTSTTKALAEPCDTERPTPRTVEEALRGPDAAEWGGAITKESKALFDNRVLTKATPGKPGKLDKVTHTNWNLKRKQSGIARARLYVCGYNHIAGEDYDPDQASSPVAGIDELRIALSLAATHRLSLTAVDASTAYLQAPLGAKPNGGHHYITITQADGTISPPYKLNRAMNGLVQSGFLWWTLVNETITGFGFRNTAPDRCVYAKGSFDTGDMMILVLYVDDLLVLAERPQDARKFLSYYREHITTSDPETAEVFRGIEISENDDGSIEISQDKYVADKVALFRQERSSQPTPIHRGADLTSASDDEVDAMHQLGYVKLYQKVLGCLNWASLCNPDIAFAVSQLARHTRRPAKRHLKAALGVFAYLNGREGRRITYRASKIESERDVPFAYSDADYQAEGSNYCVIIIMNGGPVLVLARKMSNVANSSTQAEMVGATSAATAIEYFRDLLAELTIGGYDPHRVPRPFKDGGLVPTEPVAPPWREGPAKEPLPPTVLFVDSLCVTKLSLRHKVTAASKHVANRFFYLRDLVEKGVIEIRWVPTGVNPADIGTKALGKAVFNRLLPLLYEGSFYSGPPHRPGPGHE